MKITFDKNPRSGQMVIVLIVALLVVASFLFVGGFNKVKLHDTGAPVGGDMVADTPGPGHKNLQLQTLKFKPQLGTCVEDGKDSEGKYQCNDPVTCHCASVEVTCKNNTCIKVVDHSGTAGDTTCKWANDHADFVQKPGDIAGHYDPSLGGACASTSCSGDTESIICLYKPVIYLYPTVTTNVDVSVNTNGKIVVSDPLYPQEGWKNVFAEPSGNLTYKNKSYKELFYESEVKTINQPINGIIIASNQLESRLGKITNQLGLNIAERNEFMDFWVPKLKGLNSPYILFSLLDKTTKEQNDKVIVNPLPDTRIEFIAYFKPIDFPIAVEPLKLPARPERIGFTEVEWGGMIDKGKIY